MKKKQWEPETMRNLWCQLNTDGTLSAEVSFMRTSDDTAKVRILREKDYQRLLKLARKAKRTP